MKAAWLMWKIQIVGPTKMTMETTSTKAAGATLSGVQLKSVLRNYSLSQDDGLEQISDPGTPMKIVSMKIVLSLTVAFLISCWPSLPFAALLVPDEAPKHLGELATVCGMVASANYAAGSRGRPTFLNLDKAYPNQTFTAVIWDEDRGSFGTPESTLLGKRVCATGVIQLYRGKPEIILREPRQLTPQ
jgi:hypothetical protein